MSAESPAKKDLRMRKYLQVDRHPYIQTLRARNEVFARIHTRYLALTVSVEEAAKATVELEYLSAEIESLNGLLNAFLARPSGGRPAVGTEAEEAEFDRRLAQLDSNLSAEDRAIEVKRRVAAAVESGDPIPEEHKAIAAEFLATCAAELRAAGVKS